STRCTSTSAASPTSGWATPRRWPGCSWSWSVSSPCCCSRPPRAGSTTRETPDDDDAHRRDAAHVVAGHPGGQRPAPPAGPGPLAAGQRGLPRVHGRRQPRRAVPGDLDGVQLHEAARRDPRQRQPVLAQRLLRQLPHRLQGIGGVSFWAFVWNSTFVAVVSVIATVASSAVTAYAFARIDFRGRGLWFAVMLGTLLLPFHVTMIPQYILFQRLGLINTFTA